MNIIQKIIEIADEMREKDNKKPYGEITSYDSAAIIQYLEERGGVCENADKVGFCQKGYTTHHGENGGQQVYNRCNTGTTIPKEKCGVTIEDKKMVDEILGTLDNYQQLEEKRRSQKKNLTVGEWEDLIDNLDKKLTIEP